MQDFLSGDKVVFEGHLHYFLFEEIIKFDKHSHVNYLFFDKKVSPKQPQIIPSSALIRFPLHFKH